MDRVIAYIYEADYHCIDCAAKRFGRRIFISTEGLTDREGNEPHAVAPWEEWPWHDEIDAASQECLCSDCGSLIA
jgi:hypothetical protein